MFTVWLWGRGGGFSAAEPKLHEMDRSSLKIFIGCLRGELSANWTTVAGNCMKWIDYRLSQKNFHSLAAEGGGGFFSASWTKVHEMDRSSLKVLIGCWGGVGSFLPTEPQLLEIAWNG